MDQKNVWEKLLKEALTKKGVLSEAFSSFHNYSLFNQILAYSQCNERGIPLGPIASYKKWKSLGRFVKRGIKMSVNRAGELTHNMYELHYKLPDSNRNQMKVLNMSEEQQLLYDAIFSG